MACYFLFPAYHVLGSQVLIVALFALSLDLILGYAGIVSLGHAAFFGLGAYAAGLLSARWGWHEPLSGLVVAALVAATAGFLTSFLIVRGNDLTRLMVNLGIGLLLYESANRAAFLTGGVDGLSGVSISKLFGIWGFGLKGNTAYVSLGRGFGNYVRAAYTYDPSKPAGERVTGVETPTILNSPCCRMSLEALPTSTSNAPGSTM